MKRQKAQGLVEFSLVGIIFLLLFFVAVDGGRAVYAYTTVSEAARQGAHTAEMTDSTDAQIRAAINAHTGFLGDLGTGATISPTPSRTSNHTVTITVTYQYRTITPLLSAFGPVTITSTTVVIGE
ncbi:MAG TPA: TadE/TadG family type IV pilus assembly protein [Candidatus Dormibacteraeota bacterium]